MWLASWTCSLRDVLTYRATVSGVATSALALTIVQGRALARGRNGVVVLTLVEGFAVLHCGERFGQGKMVRRCTTTYCSRSARQLVT